MTTVISEVYFAFRAVGVPEELARKAAEVRSSETLATQGSAENIEDKIVPFQHDIRTIKANVASTTADIVLIQRDLAVLKWMMGLVIAGVTAQILIAFFS